MIGMYTDIHTVDGNQYTTVLLLFYFLNCFIFSLLFHFYFKIGISVLYESLFAHLLLKISLKHLGPYIYLFF